MATQTQHRLFEAYQLGPLTLKNRVVMAPMTRSRATDNVPNALMVDYYAQRAEAGLIITEGTSPAPEGLGYARIPGCYTQAQADGWRLVTDAVHARGGAIFLQLMHTGRVSHPLNLPAGTRMIAPSPLAAPGTMWTDQQQALPHPAPEEMTLDDIQAAVAAYAHSARLAVGAGFDGVELHAANGYLLEQFLNPLANQRTDAYGGSAENRMRFVIEVVEATIAAVGAQRVGIRLSPYGVFNGMGAYDGVDAEYTQLAAHLSDRGLVYMHVLDHSAQGAPPVPASLKAALRDAFKQTLILAGGYEATSAEADLEAGRCDLVAFGRPFIANPRLVEKLQSGAELTAMNPDTLYTPGPTGYVDYPQD